MISVSAFRDDDVEEKKLSPLLAGLIVVAIFMENLICSVSGIATTYLWNTVAYSPKLSDTFKISSSKK